jgi:hypothetical protein
MMECSDYREHNPRGRRLAFDWLALGFQVAFNMGKNFVTRAFAEAHGDCCDAAIHTDAWGSMKVASP